MGIVSDNCGSHSAEIRKLRDIYGNCVSGKCGSHSAEICKAAGYIWELCVR
jgi:hypothetical protein